MEKNASFKKPFKVYLKKKLGVQNPDNFNLAAIVDTVNKVGNAAQSVGNAVNQVGTAYGQIQSTVTTPKTVGTITTPIIPSNQGVQLQSGLNIDSNTMIMIVVGIAVLLVATFLLRKH